MTSFDTIIIGGGHNGLVAAGLMAKAGRRTLLLEASDMLGGALRDHEFAPGFRSGGLVHMLNRLSREALGDLGISADSFGAENLPTVLLSEGKAPVILRGAYGTSLEGVDAEEARRFSVLRETLLRQAAILRRFLSKAPPRPGAIGPMEMLGLAGAGFELIRHGRAPARDFARMLLMNVADVADEYLTDDRLKGLLAFDATLGIHLGPRSPTSLLGLYYRLTGEAGGLIGGQIVPKGGFQTLTGSLQAALARAGGTVRLSAPVARILTAGGGVSGVRLENGEEISATEVIAAIHPGSALQGMLAPGEIDTGLSAAIRKIRSKGNVARLSLALDRLPEIAGLTPNDLRGRMVIAPSVNQVENAFNPAKYGAFSPDPVMEFSFPSLHNPHLAAGNGAVLSALVQFAPYDLKGGWDSGRATFLENVLKALERAVPGLSQRIVGSELLVPPDIEARYRMPGGHWHHGELQADRMLLNRPVFALSDYSTPIDGLFLASAGCHPGGGISGLAGRNAARAILKRRRS
jgi:phytoene dehydrogenase-like protein